MKRILSSIATLLLIPCLPLAFMAVSQAAAERTAQKNEASVISADVAGDVLQSGNDQSVEKVDALLDIHEE